MRITASLIVLACNLVGFFINKFPINKLEWFIHSSNKMIHGDDYHITVMSNVKDERSRSSHFYNKLSTPLVLHGDWKVGIKKIIYLNSFLTIIDEYLEVYHPETHSLSYQVSKLEAGDLRDDEHNLMLGVDEIVGKKNLIVMLNASHYEKAHSFDKVEIKFFKAGEAIGPLAPEATVITVPGMDAKKRHEEHIPMPEGADAVTLVVYRDISERFPIPRGYYPTIQDLVKEINKSKDITKYLKISVDKNNRVKITFQNNAFGCFLQNDLHFILGFAHPYITVARLDLPAIGQYEPQPNRGRFAFFIYSNLVKSGYVGDSQVSLLDVINIAPRTYHGQVVSTDVLNPIYQPVTLKLIEDIEIKIASDSGEEIFFDNSDNLAKTLIVLHFVKV